MGATTRVAVENSSGDFVEVRCIVFSRSNTMIYIDDPGKAYVKAAHMHVSRDGLGVVFLENEPPLPGLKSYPQQFGKLPGKSR